MTLVDVLLLGGAPLILAPPQGAMVLAVDLTLMPPLAPLLGGGMIASGTKVSALSSMMNSLAGRSSLAGVGTPTRAKVEEEPMKEWPAMLEFEVEKGEVEES